ncbi:DUF6228 family protein [Microbacterium sp. 179-I 3D3 NHS]|uniref:DUF6228 family protein n=1 Tax=Microbacterium sp. 179-I 3D3 NHS TaxID=3142382 RepID=UPI0039A3C75E
MTVARVGTNSEFLEIMGAPDSGTPTRATVRLALEGMTAATTIEQHWSDGFGDLAAFFADLEAHWRGWSGSKTWQSMEGDLVLDAEHTDGRLKLHVTVRRERFDRANDGWVVEGDLTIDLGEQLSQISRDVAVFARGSGA